ncbi:hypothetical protein RclHR1_02880013 [Rhizophagus clarus]|uniref:Ran GDP/GTP exchange factor n=1 Tax=Rhizophagus clarus TaxID=94130 RepID=A0A2Z6R3I0_9GLOM|nr:hypothetical protein RclHR1_02880013 [Rhizophagus clarus]GET02151.1 Ran GDP/GTP exchange factor [Rhizophagus clarus]
MVGKRTHLKQQAVEELTIDKKYIRRSVRIQVARNAQKTAIIMSDQFGCNVTTERSTSTASDISSVASLQSERKRKEVSEGVNVSPSNDHFTNRVSTISKKLKSTQVDSTQVGSSVSSTINEDSQTDNRTAQPKRRGRPPKNPQTTTTTQKPTQSKRRGRPPKTALTAVLPATDSTLAKQSRKRENHAVEYDHSKILRPKRRKGDTFTVPVPTRPQQIGRVYVIGSNELAQCGIGDSDVTEVTKLSIIRLLDKFNIVDISAGSLHNAALTVDGKVVTWGCNDHGTLGRFTETPDSAREKAILEAGNFDIGEEGNPAYAEGLDNVNVVKVACGGNATFVISDQGHLYATGTFKDNDGIIGFSQDSCISEPIFTRCKPFMYLTIVDIAAGEDHVLALTREGDVYAWGNDEAHRLGRKYSKRRSLEPFNLGLKHIVRLYAGSYHNFVIDKNDQVWVFGFNNTGQCGLDVIRQAIIPPEKHPFFKGHKVEEFALGQHHTLTRMQNGSVYSFGRSDYGQLGLGDDVTKLQHKETKAIVVIPTIIPDLSSIKLIEAGDNFSMAVDDANNIYAWGFGEYCVLGNEKDDDMTSPFQIPHLEELEDKEIVRISCGSSHGLFLVS